MKINSISITTIKKELNITLITLKINKITKVNIITSISNIKKVKWRHNMIYETTLMIITNLYFLFHTQF
jgi:hypothetical protein